MDSRAREVIRQGDSQFARGSIMSLWQEHALNFYTQRANFTSKRNEGEELADHLFSSYPERARQELANILPEYLRPGKFFSIHVDDEEIDEGDVERSFLEHMTEIMWRAMTAGSNIVKASLQTDHDFVTFGNGVLKYGLNELGNGFLFQNFHLRDTAWMENAAGKVDCVHRNWAPTAKKLVEKFGDKVSTEVKRAYEKDPSKTFSCRHVVMPSRLYDYKSRGGKEFPFVSLYVECGSETMLEEVGQNQLGYVIPRWQTVSDSVYGVSMATSILLPDSRTLQVCQRTLREAGEKYVDPPMIAITDAIRGDLALYAGGVTTADIEYDERLGDVLRPINQSPGSMPIGFEIAQALKEDIRSGFFLDKIQLPETGREMTATEVRRRIQEHIRAAAPISKPIQEEYNEPWCEGVLQILMDQGAFPLDMMPESLQDREIKFKFRSPLDELAEQNEADTFVDVMTRIVMPALELDPSQIENVNMTEALRDAMRAGGFKAKWFNPEGAVAQKREQMMQEQKAQQMMQEVNQMGMAAEQGGKGVSEIANAVNAAGMSELPSAKAGGF